MRDIYIAGKLEAQERLKHERSRIHRLGVGKVVGTWLDEESGNPTPQQKLEYADRDTAEVLLADLLILDTNDENNRGGREVEYGIALGTGIEVWVVGPKRNVFHEKAAHFLDWDDALDALVKEAS
jgi:hypothetical protein